MSEPKKETVRIVLPPRREGQPLASTPRETAMINLPAKPVPAGEAAAAPAPPPAMPVASAPPMPAPPAGLQPPSAPGVPKPPSFPGVPKPPASPSASTTAPLAPMRPPSAPGIPKPASVTPSVSKAPGSPTVMLRPPPSAGTPTPVSVKPEAKKETAKVASGIAVKPQATVRLQQPPSALMQPSQTASASFQVKSSSAIVPLPEPTEEEIPMNWSIAALVMAIIALALQIWTMTLTS